MRTRNLLSFATSTLLVFFFCLSGRVGYSEIFNVAPGDTAGLIAAINTANANGEPDTINLAAGRYTLAVADNGTSLGPNGLPVINSVITINGVDAETTIIERTGAPRFRVFSIAISGNLSINRVNVRGGNVGLLGTGAGFYNAGNLTVNDSVIEDHIFAGEGGAIYNIGNLSVVRTQIRNSASQFEGGAILNGGTMTIESSSVTGNAGDGSTIGSPGEAIIRNSTIADNFANHGSAISGRIMTIVGSTIAHNFGAATGGGVQGGEGMTIVNSTITKNNTGHFSSVGAVWGSNVELQNTIVAGNQRDCSGTIISAGNNFVGDTCDGIQLLPSDLTGDPGMDAFVDDGAPGHGRFPLLPSSLAIDRGNYSLCLSDPSLATDQVGLPRRGACDIGSTEFYPIVNEALSLTGISTSFDPSPVPGGPAGTFLIIAVFRNNSTQTIAQPFVQVSNLSEGNLLLNAKGGRGSVGAWLPLPGTGPFAQGASRTVELRIGLQQLTPFTFFVNVLGDQ